MSQDISLGFLLALSAVTVATVAGWTGAALAGVVVARMRHRSAALRARRLARARLLPLAVTVVLVPSQAIAFVRFEAGGREAAGPLLLTLALAGLSLVAGAIRGGYQAACATRDVERRWRQSATPFTLPGWVGAAWLIRRRYPVVAMLGILRPQLFVARQVTTACTDEELAAIAAHEHAHRCAGDNLLRWLFCVTPGASLFARIGKPLERGWMAAAEAAADSAARHEASSLDLASALTKVARLAAGAEHEAVTASTLMGGCDLTARVERLLDSTADPHPSRSGWLAVTAAVAVVILLQTAPVALTLHELFESFVRR